MPKYFIRYIKVNLVYHATSVQIYPCIFCFHESMRLVFSNHTRKGPLQDVPLTVMLQPHPKSFKGDEHNEWGSKELQATRVRVNRNIWDWSRTNSSIDAWQLPQQDALWKSDSMKFLSLKGLLILWGTNCCFYLVPCVPWILLFYWLPCQRHLVYFRISLFGLWCHLISLTWCLVRSFYQSLILRLLVFSFCQVSKFFKFI